MAVDRIGDGLALRSKGDIVSHDGTSIISISPGTDGQILTAQSSTTSGIVWASVSTGDAQYYSLIASTYLTANAQNITFSNIPATYDELVLIFRQKRGDSAGRTVSQIDINSTTNAESSWRYIVAGNNGGQSGNNWVGFGNGGTTGGFNSFYLDGSQDIFVELHAYNYATSYKKVLTVESGYLSGVGSTEVFQGWAYGSNNESAAISSITVFAGNAGDTTYRLSSGANYQFNLYGVKYS